MSASIRMLFVVLLTIQTFMQPGLAQDLPVKPVAWPVLPPKLPPQTTTSPCDCRSCPCPLCTCPTPPPCHETTVSPNCGGEQCTGSDCVSCYNIETQSCCEQITRGPVGGSTLMFKAGLHRYVDALNLQGTIIAYRLRWFNGGWSGWFVPGVNDIDIKYNIYGFTAPPLTSPPGSMRRWWSYFTDHTHSFIICHHNP